VKIGIWNLTSFSNKIGSILLAPTLYEIVQQLLTLSCKLN